MSYCINPRCQERENPANLEFCQYCGTELIVAGEFRLLRPLRRSRVGSASEVFVAERSGTPKFMKVLLPRNQAQVERLEREALVLQILNHPGVPDCDIDDYFLWRPGNNQESYHCLVMDLIEGEDLEQWSTTNGPASQEQTIDWLEQLTAILKLLHTGEDASGDDPGDYPMSLGMEDSGFSFIHCDVKPENVILRPDGRLVLVDFGFVTPVGQGTGSTTLGSAGYIAPEQANGMPVVQSDFFSLGRTMIRLATGRPLHTLESNPLTGQLQWQASAPQIEQPLAELLNYLTAGSLGLRPPTDQAILNALKELPRQLRLARRRRRLRSRPALAIYGLLLMLFGVGVYWGGINFISYWYFAEGANAQVNGDLEAARSSYKKSIWFNAKNGDALNNLAVACGRLGDNQCAIESYERIFQINPDDWAGRYNLGNFYDELGQYKQAEEQYRLAQQANNNLAADATNNLSRLKNLQGEYSAAATLAQQVLPQTRDSVTQAALYKNLGWANLGQRRYAEAEKNLTLASSLDPERADIYCLLAQVKQAQGEILAARRDWKQCLQLDDSDLPEVKKWREELVDRLAK